MQGGITLLMTGSDVQKSDLIGTLLVVATGDLNRITGITDIFKLHTLDHAAVIDV